MFPTCTSHGVHQMSLNHRQHHQKKLRQWSVCLIRIERKRLRLLRSTLLHSDTLIDDIRRDVSDETLVRSRKDYFENRSYYLYKFWRYFWTSSAVYTDFVYVQVIQIQSGVVQGRGNDFFLRVSNWLCARGGMVPSSFLHSLPLLYSSLPPIPFPL